MEAEDWRRNNSFLPTTTSSALTTPTHGGTARLSGLDEYQETVIWLGVDYLY